MNRSSVSAGALLAPDEHVEPAVSASPWWVLTPGRITRLAAALVVVQLLARAWVAAKGNFYWDDLILAGRGAKYPLLSKDLLLYDHDGHFMPAAFFTAGVLTRLAPYHWGVVWCSLLLLQLIASLSVLRLLKILLDRRPVLLIPFLVYLLSPLTLPSFAWWSVALNDLPMQAGLAWAAGDAVLLLRTGRRRYAVSGLLAFLVSLLFFEKSIIIPWFAMATVYLVLRVDGTDHALRQVLRRCRAFWVPALGLTLAWAGVYTSVVSSRLHVPYTLTQAAELLERGLFLSFLPALLGGPFSWRQEANESPWATPSPVLVALGALVMLLVVGGTLVWKQRVGLVWALVLVILMASLVAMVLGRSGPHTGLILPQTLRYIADMAVVMAAATALILRAPTRPENRRDTPSDPRLLGGLAVVATSTYVVACLVSTSTFATAWSHYRTDAYLTTARASLEHAKAPLLDQAIAQDVLWRVANPNNQAAQVLGPMKPSAFSTSTTALSRLDDTGHIVPAELDVVRSAVPGPRPQCGYQLQDQVGIPLDGPVYGWGWTLDIGYLADHDETLTINMGPHPAVRIPVHAGLHQVFVRVLGEGANITITRPDHGTPDCIGAIHVGLVHDTP